MLHKPQTQACLFFSWKHSDVLAWSVFLNFTMKHALPLLANDGLYPSGKT